MGVAGSMASEEIWENEANSCLNPFDPRISRKNSCQLDSGSSSSELSLAIVDMTERLRKTCGITQQSSFPEGEESKSRKLSTTSADSVDSRRSSIAATQHGLESSAKTSPGKGSTGKETKPTPLETARPSLSSTEGASVIPSITAALPLPQQVTVVPQQSPKADTSPDKNKDNKVDAETSRTIKKSQGGVCKKSSLSATPLISVSSVIEDVCVEEEVPPPDKAREEATGKPPSSDAAPEKSEALSEDARESTEGQPKDPNVCPWEDE